LTAAAAAAALSASVAHAQRRPQRLEPHIEYVFPAGAQRGTTVEATIAGQNLLGAHTVRVNGEGVTGTVDKVADARNVKVTLTVAPDAQLGEREIRLMTPVGVSNRFRFFVGQFPEVREVEPNSEKGQAQRIESLPVVINGQVMPGDRDYFRFTAEAGQTLVCQLDARRLLPFIADAVPGWNDGCLTLYDGQGRELLSVDDFRFKPDPVLIYQVPKDGEYIIEVRDIIFRGRADFVYRLTIGALPYITHIYPLGARRNTTAKVELFGVNLVAHSLDLVLPEDSPERRTIELTQQGILSNGLPFAVGDLPEIEEKEPNDSLAAAQRVEVPATINGRIQSPDDEDYFVFHAKAGERLLLEVYARRLDSPLDSVLTLLNPKGQEMAENDDTVDIGEPLVTHQADSRLVAATAADGDYTVRIRDIQGKGGQEYAYRLVIAPVRPDFYLHISPDNPHMAQGDTSLITITAGRKDGFNGEIKLSAQDLPEGFVVSDAVIPAGGTRADMTITSPPETPMGFLSPSIVGTATVDKETVTHQAMPAEEQTQAFSFRLTVPTQELLLAVMESPPFKLSLDLPPGKIIEVPQGGEAQVVIKVARKETAKEAPKSDPKANPSAAKEEAQPDPKAKPDAAKEEPKSDPKAKPAAAKEQPQPQIVLSTGYPLPPAGLSIKTAFIAPEMDGVAVTILAAKNAPPEIVRNLIISGTGRFGTENVTRIAPAIPVKVIPPPDSGGQKK
jgi:hypothetical protein